MNTAFSWTCLPINANLMRNAAIIAIATLTLAACAAPPPSETINDPEEAHNRQIHEFNRGLDKVLFRPASSAYGNILPEPVQQGVSNFAKNLDLPADVLNNIIQARPVNAGHNTLRFVVNTVLGVGGLFDPASSLGLTGKPTGFGETLHVWGAGEGVYVELPAFGPSNERDAVGLIVDFATNPVSYILPTPERYIGTVANVGSILSDRNRYSATIDSILYGSADSYAQARLLYLQNRRFELGQTTTTNEDTFLDPYEDLDGK